MTRFWYVVEFLMWCIRIGFLMYDAAVVVSILLGKLADMLF